MTPASPCPGEAFSDGVADSRTAVITALVAKAKRAFPDDTEPAPSEHAAMLRDAKRDAVIAAAVGRAGVGTLAELDGRELGLVGRLLDDVLAGKAEVHLNAVGRFVVRPRMGAPRRHGGGGGEAAR